MDQQAVNANPAPQSVPQAPMGEITPQGAWPGAWGMFKYSSEVVKLNVWTILAIIGISFGLSIIINMIFPQQAVPVAGDIMVQQSNPIADILGVLVMSLTAVLSIAVMLAGVRREKMSLGRAFSKLNIGLYLKYVGATIVVAILYVVSMLALVIPFFFIAPRLALYGQFLVDKNMGVMESIKASWNATKGNYGKLYGLFGVYIVFALLIFVLVGLYLLLMYSAVVTLLYKYLMNNQQEAVTQPAAAPAPAPTSTPASM